MQRTDDHKTVGRFLTETLGGMTNVWSHRDEEEKTEVDIFTVEDVPTQNIATYATIGLFQTDLRLTSNGMPLRIEVLLALPKSVPYGPNIVATCAFNIMKGDQPGHLGAIHPRVIELYDSTTSMTDLLLVGAFAWDLRDLTLAGNHLTWLQVIPISPSERVFTMTHGFKAIEGLFEEQQIDFYDLNRPPVI